MAERHRFKFHPPPTCFIFDGPDPNKGHVGYGPEDDKGHIFNIEKGPYSLEPGHGCMSAYMGFNLQAYRVCACGISEPYFRALVKKAGGNY